jgi:hypothetical protein
MSDLLERLRECSRVKQGQAWSRMDGGHDLCIGAMLAEEAADEIERLRKAMPEQGCPECSGDCSAVDVPVMFCPNNAPPQAAPGCTCAGDDLYFPCQRQHAFSQCEVSWLTAEIWNATRLLYLYVDPADVRREDEADIKRFQKQATL